MKISNRHLLLVIFFITLPTFVLYGQAIGGRVQTHERKAIEAASIALFSLPDSSFIAGAQSDTLGYFKLSFSEAYPEKKAKILLRVSCIGYKTTQISTTPDSLPSNIILEEDLSALKEVVVVARRKGQQIDRRAFSFSEKIKSASHSSRDLLRLLPDVHIDFVSGAINSISNGGKIILLVNGIESTPQQLKSISPRDVKEIVYYDVPPSRFADAGAVVDIIVPKLNEGLSYGIDILGVLTTGFIEGSTFAKYIKGRHIFEAEYGLSYREYSNRLSSTLYKYQLLNQVRSINKAKEDSFGYTMHTPTLRYSYILPERESLILSLSSQGNRYHSEGESMNTYTKNTDIEINKAIERESSQYLAPTIDFYYSRRLSQKHELSTNIKTVFYSTQATESNHEYAIDGRPTLIDDMVLDNKSVSLSAEVAHNYQGKLGTWSTGYRLTHTSIDYNVNNYHGHQKYTTRNQKHYAYTQLRGTAGKLSYIFGLGLTHLHYSQSGVNNKNTVLTPNLTLGQSLSKGQSLRFQFGVSASAPHPSWASKNKIIENQDISRVGNPNLKSSNYYWSRLIHALESKWIDITSSLLWGYERNAIYQNYQLALDESGYEQSYHNAIAEYLYSGTIQLSVKPFGEMLTLGLMANPRYNRLRTELGNYGHFSIRNRASLTFVKGNLFVQYAVAIPEWSYSMAQLSSTRETHSLYLQYKLKDWAFTLGWSIIGAPSTYKTKTMSISPVSYYAHTDIYDNKNMVLMGISYSYSKGKQQEVNRKLQGETSGAITF